VSASPVVCLAVTAAAAQRHFRIECLTVIAWTVEQLEAVRESCRQDFRVEKVRRDEVPEWDFVDGALQHRSRGFFSVVGVASGASDPGRLMLYQPQAALTGLLYSHIQGEACFLVQARGEPGNVGEVQFGPTLQSTPANYLRLHGGASSPYADMFTGFDPHLSIVGDTTQADLGCRYLMKSKRQIVAEYRGELIPKPGFVWASASAIREALTLDTYINIDLRTLLALTPWGAGDASEWLVPESRLVRRSLRRPVRPDVLGAVFASGRRRVEGVDIVPIESLENWRVDEWSLYEIEPRQRFAIEFYRVQAQLREVPAWSQPLLNSHGQGYCGLACRESAEGLEVQIRVVHEPGLALGWGLAPTVMSYPGEATGIEDCHQYGAGPVSVSAVQSDEGGRFFRDDGVYELFWSERDVASEHLFWVNLSELKTLLNTSNVCTIQLRGLAPHLLCMS
jgi:dTDP-4-dehydro-6-deoxy-alpha-D-glucopyranose 2,3-dehydratase